MTATRSVDGDQDHRLLEQALAGDERAWRLFYQRFHRLVSFAVARVLRRYRGVFDESEVADFSAEVWVALLAEDRRKLRCYDPSRCRLATWIKLLATNCTIDRLRGGDRGLAGGEQEALEWVVDERPSADDQLALRQQAEIARQALEQLRLKDQRFVARCLAETSAPREVARELGISIHTVHSRKFKIRQKLTRIVRRIERDRGLSSGRLPDLGLCA